MRKNWLIEGALSGKALLHAIVTDRPAGGKVISR
jgi:hypothetical protein